MNKLSQKFITGIVGILAISTFCSILFNTQFIKRFYLFQKKNAITRICSEFTDLLQQRTPTQAAIEQIEASHKVIIVGIENDPISNSDKINLKIQAALQEKGIGFQKYWFWEEDYKKVLEGENRIRLYQQENLNYSLLVEYVQNESSIYAITMIVPNVSDAFRIANNFLILVNITTIIIAVLFIILLIKRITRPLSLFEDFAEHMSNSNFTPIEVHTKDELERVADNLNSMGSQIIQSQKSLQEKNSQMEQLLDNVAHDLNTPISLIQLYANGIKDGIDDGTFLDIIIEENQQMSNMVNRLLYLSKIEKNQYNMSQINLSDMVRKLINKYSVLAEENEMVIHSSIENDLILIGSEDLLQSLFLNLITNAVKYSSGKEIVIHLLKSHNEIIFTIMNESDNEMLDVDKIWTPYYVGEQSRNKKLSGMGLGLSIVHKICAAQNYSVNCALQENNVVFRVSIPAGLSRFSDL